MLALPYCSRAVRRHTEDRYGVIVLGKEVFRFGKFVYDLSLTDLEIVKIKKSLFNLSIPRGLPRNRRYEASSCNTARLRAEPLFMRLSRMMICDEQNACGSIRI